MSATDLLPLATGPMPLTIRPALSDADWAEVRAVRQRVFVQEQACPPQDEWDAYDVPERRGVDVHHLLASAGGATVGVARWRPVQIPDGEWAKLERFAVLPEARGAGHGRALVAAALDAARAAGHRRFVLHAQVYLQALYESFGFAAVGEAFDEAGIEHVKMALKDD